MKLHLTDGRSLITVIWSFDLDRATIDIIRAAKMPVQKAFELAKKRLGVTQGIRPINGQALEGI